MPLIKVARTGDIPPGTGKVIEAGETEVALFNVGGTFYALDNHCTHLGGPLGEGAVEGTRVTCPWHGGMFDITTGGVVAPPPRRDVAAYPVRVERDEVFVELP